MKDVAGSNDALAAETNIITIVNLYSALYAKDTTAFQQVKYPEQGYQGRCASSVPSLTGTLSRVPCCTSTP